MNDMKHYFDVSLPDSIWDHIKLTTVFDPVPDIHKQTAYYDKDAFCADGTPASITDGQIYPCYAAWYLGYPIPRTYLEVNSLYRKTASIAAMQWLTKILAFDDIQCETRHFGGERLDIIPGSIPPANAAVYPFSFPDMAIICSNNSTLPFQEDERVIPVIPWPDSRENDIDWEQGTIPAYAEAQARLTLWCWRHSYECGHRSGKAPEYLYIVRITGNTPGDLLVRTVRADDKKDEMIATRVYRAFDKAVSAGKDPMENLNRKEQMTWLEKKQEDEAYAFRIDDPDFHDIVRQYMEVASERKTLEAKQKGIKAEMDCIAISLASQIHENALGGTVTSGGVTYQVNHTPKKSQGASVSAALVQQYFPEHLDLIEVREYPKERVSVEVL